jgi:hypothetical protein
MWQNRGAIINTNLLWFSKQLENVECCQYKYIINICVDGRRKHLESIMTHFIYALKEQTIPPTLYNLEKNNEMIIVLWHML